MLRFMRDFAVDARLWIAAMLATLILYAMMSAGCPGTKWGVN